MNDTKIIYRISYVIGNDYNCSCCRQTWCDDTDVHSKEEIVQWLKNYEKKRINGDDILLSRIEVIGGEITHEFDEIREKLKEEVEEEMRKDKEEKRKIEEAEKIEAEKYEIEREKAKLRELAKKYPKEIQ